MLTKLNHDKKFSKIITKHIISIANHLFENNYHFGILCRIDNVTFTPDLSSELKAEFRPMTLFFLSGYTFESARMDDNFLYFEAGFGSSDQGSLVTVPLEDIIQIILDETPIFVNSTTNYQVNKEEPKEVSQDARESSFAALMSNPENKKFLKKK